MQPNASSRNDTERHASGLKPAASLFRTDWTTQNDTNRHERSPTMESNKDLK